MKEIQNLWKIIWENNLLAKKNKFTKVATIVKSCTDYGTNLLISLNFAWNWTLLSILKGNNSYKKKYVKTSNFRIKSEMYKCCQICKKYCKYK
jgi:hypothetical protein